MTDTLRSPAQAFPAAGQRVVLYKVPAAPPLKSAVVSSITVCNHSNLATTFRVSVAIFGAPDAPAQYLYRDMPLAPNDTFIATIGVTLGESDEIRVSSASGTVSFNTFPVEVS